MIAHNMYLQHWTYFIDHDDVMNDYNIINDLFIIPDWNACMLNIINHLFLTLGCLLRIYHEILKTQQR